MPFHLFPAIFLLHPIFFFIRLHHKSSFNTMFILYVDARSATLLSVSSRLLTLHDCVSYYFAFYCIYTPYTPYNSLLLGTPSGLLQYSHSVRHHRWSDLCVPLSLSLAHSLIASAHPIHHTCSQLSSSHLFLSQFLKTFCVCCVYCMLYDVLYFFRFVSHIFFMWCLNTNSFTTITSGSGGSDSSYSSRGRKTSGFNPLGDRFRAAN